MPKVLTTGSEVLCGIQAAASHGGNVSVTSSAKLKVNGNSVLVRSSVEGKPVAGCQTPNDSTKSLKTCTSATSVTAGEASKLTVGGQPALLDTVTGITDGNPPGTVPADAKQDKLTAI